MYPQFEKPTKTELETAIWLARDKGKVVVAVPFSNAVYRALDSLAAEFPFPTEESIKAVYAAFDEPHQPLI